MTRLVTFPGLDLTFNLHRVAFTVFGHPVYWYGVIIAAGFLLAVFYCCHRAPKHGIKPDDFIDVLFVAVPISIVGARLYYIIFYLDFFRKPEGGLDFLQMVRIWDGGIAIYGAVIAGFATLLVFCKVKKLNFFAFADVMVFGLLIGQCVGRWGNFVNAEAYGSETTLPWRMGIDAFVGGTWQYMEVHPTFLYESLWNLVGLVLLIAVARKWRKFDGQIMLGYFLWYGVGRGIIEGLRTDSLYFFGTGLRVSQLLGFATALVAAVFLVYHLAVRKHRPEELYVNRVKTRMKSDPQTQATTKLAPTELGPEEEQHGNDN